MRLNQQQINTINNLARVIFGKDTKVALFGSRTNDSARGGDIDLFISNKMETRLTIETKAHFLAQLKIRIGDQKIDVVFDNASTRKKKNFYNSIIQQKVDLITT